MKKFFALVLALVMALSLCVPAWGAAPTYYVSPTGSDDAGTGASDAPFASIEKAFVQARTDGIADTGFTVELAAGTYGNQKVKYGGHDFANVTVKAADGADVTVNGIQFTMHLNSMTNTVVEGITFAGAQETNIVNGLSAACTVVNLTVKNCTFKNYGVGVSVVQDSSLTRPQNVTVDNCTFDLLGTLGEGSSAIYFQTIEGFTVNKCTFTNVCYNAIQANTLITGDVAVTNNTFGTIGSRNVYLNGITDAYAGDLDISGNTFAVPTVPKADGNFVKMGTTNALSFGPNSDGGNTGDVYYVGCISVPAPPAPSVPVYPYYPPVVEDTTDTKVDSAQTFDAGIALYVGVSVLGAMGTVALGKKRED